MMTGGKELLIEAGTGSVSIRADERRPIEYRTNGEPEERTSMRGSVSTVATWKGEKLVIATDNERGQIEHTYSLDEGRLVVKTEVKLEGSRAVSFKRVYERADVAASEESQD